MKNDIEKTTLMQILSEITEFRNPKLIEYTIPEVLIVVIIGTLVGLKYTLHIHEFAKAHVTWFKSNLGLQKVPSHDTMDRVLGFINHKELDAALTVWLDQLMQDKQIRKRLVIDGKKVDKNSKNNTNIVRAFLPSLHQVKGAEKVVEYQNEITTIPKLIKKLSINGYLISIDAIGTQFEIVNLILNKNAHYLLPVKRNQKALHSDIKYFVDSEIEANNQGVDIFETHNKGHGRFEIRRCYAFKDVQWLTQRHKNWQSIRSFCVLQCVRTIREKSVTTYRLYIASLVLTAKEFIEEIRAHWSIENNLHWLLNQSFYENKILSKNSNFIMNFSLILTTALTLVAKEKKKISFTLQKLKFSWNLTYALKLLCPEA